MRRGDYGGAAEAYRLQESDEFYDPVLKQRLAACLLRTGEPERARIKLGEALALAPMDPSTWFLLGDAHAALGRSEDAILAYQQYLNLGGPSRSEVRAEIERLRHQSLVRGVRAAIGSGTDAVPAADSTVAVSPFLNVAGEEEFASLSQGLAALLIDDLRKVGAFRVLERERLGVLVEELARSRAERGLTPPGSSSDGVGSEGAGAPARDSADIDSADLGDADTDGVDLDHVGDPRRADPGRADLGRAALGNADSGSIDPGNANLGDAAARAPAAGNGGQTEALDTGDGMADDVGGEARSAESAAREAAWVSLRVEPPPVDSHTAPTWGTLLGVQNFVQGFFTRLGPDRILIGADVVSAQGKAESAGAPLEGPLEELLHLEKGLARRVLAALGVTPSEEEERELDVILTGSPEAFLAYSRGLRFLDEGRAAEARNAFHAAVVADPLFTEAADAEALAAADAGSFDRLRAEIWNRLIPVGAAPIVDLGLIDIAVRVGGGPAPDGADPDGGTEPVGLLGPADPDRIDVRRTIPSLPPPPGAGGTPR